MNGTCMLSRCYQKPTYYVYLHFVFKSLSKRGWSILYYFLWEACVLRHIKYEQINAACSQIKWMKRLFFFFSKFHLRPSDDNLTNVMTITCRQMCNLISFLFIRVLNIQKNLTCSSMLISYFLEEIVWHFGKYTFTFLLRVGWSIPLSYPYGKHEETA